MGNFRPFRYWFYLRTGYQLYFSFVFAAVNTLVVTYFLAIEKAPFLKEVFPTFVFYAVFSIILGIPILIFTGLVHFKKAPAFKSEQDIAYESNPYVYKLPPGYWLEVIMPFYLMSSKIMLKLSKNENLTEDEINEINELQKKMEYLNKGGYVGIQKGKKLPFSVDNKEKK